MHRLRRWPRTLHQDLSGYWWNRPFSECVRIRRHRYVDHDGDAGRAWAVCLLFRYWGNYGDDLVVATAPGIPRHAAIERFLRGPLIRRGRVPGYVGPPLLLPPILSAPPPAHLEPRPRPPCPRAASSLEADVPEHRSKGRALDAGGRPNGRVRKRAAIFRQSF